MSLNERKRGKGGNRSPFWGGRVLAADLLEFFKFFLLGLGLKTTPTTPLFRRYMIYRCQSTPLRFIPPPPKKKKGARDTTSPNARGGLLSLSFVVVVVLSFRQIAADRRSQVAGHVPNCGSRFSCQAAVLVSVKLQFLCQITPPY